MKQLPGGAFRVGTDRGDDDERPVHEVHVASFAIDVTEVTAGHYGECARAGACGPGPTAVRWDGASPARVREQSPFCTFGRDDRLDHPMICVSWDEAAAYCAWAGKRLPTEVEWEYAARGGDARLYPWGDAPSASTLCFDRWTSRRGTCPVGSFPAGVGRFGLEDMAGSAWEWTASPYCTYGTTACDEGVRVFRGGGWYAGAIVTTTDRGRAAPGERLVDVGFRCAR